MPYVSQRFWLVTAFDLSQWKEFIPDPALHKTIEKAKSWIARNSSTSVKYTYQEVRVASNE